MNIKQIKNALRTSKIMRFEVRVDANDVEEAQQFLLKNGFTWISGKEWVILKSYIYGFVLFYIYKENRYCMLYNTSFGSNVLTENVMEFRDLIGKESVKNLVSDNFVSDLFIDIV